MSDIRFTTTPGATVNIDTPYTVGDLIFGPATGTRSTTMGSFTLNGAALSIQGQDAGLAETGTAWGTTYAILNNASANQTINNRINLLGSSTIATVTNGGSLTFGAGGVDIASGATLTVLQNGFVTTNFNGVISGAGALALKSTNAGMTPGILASTGIISSAISLGAANTYTGATTISNTFVYINANAALGAAGALGNNTSSISFVGGAGIIEGALITGNYQVDRSFNSLATGNGNTQILGGTNTSGTATFTGQYVNQTGTSNANTLFVTAAAGGNVLFNGANAGGNGVSGLIINHSGTTQTSNSPYLYGATDALVKVGAGTVTMNGMSNYWGQTIVRAGVLSVNALANGGTFVDSGDHVSLKITSGTSGYSSIGTSSSAASNVVLAGGTLQYTGAAVSTDRLFTVSTAGGSLDASGTGAVNFTNTGANVAADSSSAHTATFVTAAGGAAAAGVSTTTLNFADVQSGDVGSTAYGSNSSIDMAVGETITVNGVTATITSINVGTSGVGTSVTLNQAVTSTGGTVTPVFGAVNRTLTLTGTNTGNNMISGSLSDSTAGGKLSLAKTGAGTWVLAGANTYTGATAVSAGRLLLNAGTLASGSAVTVAANGTGAALFGGVGTVGGTVFVGNGTGSGASILNVGLVGAVGTLNTGAVTFGTNSELAFTLNSTTGAISLLNVTGTLTLGNGLATLVGTDIGGGTLAVGQTLTLATATGGITGTFNGYADGSTYTLGGESYKISYGANAVTLQVLSVPEPGTYLLLGLGGAVLFAASRRRRVAA